jgi:hypothetical protein
MGQPSMVHERTGESERVGEQSEHPLRGVFAMFARTPRTLANIVRLVRYVRHRQSSAKLAPSITANGTDALCDVKQYDL